MSTDTAIDLIRNGTNVAIVFRVCEHIGNCKCPIPTEYLGIPVHNGDKHDARFIDPVGVWVGLKAKGKAKQDVKGFVIKV